MSEAGKRIAVLSAAAAAAALAAPASNPDLFWHLSAARRWLETGSMPAADWLSFTMAGRPWLNFEWLVQIIWHGLFTHGGYAALWLLKLAVLGAAALLVGRAAAGGRAVKAFAALAWVLALGGANDLRPENFSLLFFAALLCWLEQRRLRPVGSRSRLEAPALAAFFALWSNLHAGWAYGLALLGVYLAADAWRSKRWTGLLPLPAAAAAVLLNPHGAGAYEVILLHAADLKLFGGQINEWRPPALDDLKHAPFWALFAASAAVAAFSWLKRLKIPLEHAAAAALFAASALRAARTIPYFAAVAVVFLAATYARDKLSDARRKWVGISAALAAAAFWLAAVPRVLAGPAYFDPANVPLRMAEFLARERAALESLRLYNTWHWGGYLGWRNPGMPVFQDGRYLFAPLLARKQEALSSPEAFGRFLAEFSVDVVVLERGTWMRRAPMRTRAGVIDVPRPFYLDYFPDTDWLMAYWDAKGYVFVRRAAVPAAWARERGYTLFRPDDLRAAALLLDSGQAAPAAARADVARFAADMSELPGEKDSSSAAAQAWLKQLGI